MFAKPHLNFSEGRNRTTVDIAWVIKRFYFYVIKQLYFQIYKYNFHMNKNCFMSLVTEAPGCRTCSSETQSQCQKERATNRTKYSRSGLCSWKHQHIQQGQLCNVISFIFVEQFVFLLVGQSTKLRSGTKCCIAYNLKSTNSSVHYSWIVISTLSNYCQTEEHTFVPLGSRWCSCVWSMW